MGQRKTHNTPWLALNATAETRQGRYAHWCKSGMKVMEINFGVGFEDYSSGGNSCLVLTENIVKAHGSGCQSTSKDLTSVVLLYGHMLPNCLLNIYVYTHK